MNKQILSLAIPLVSIALPAILAFFPALADNSNTLQIDATQPVVAAPIFSDNAADQVMRRKKGPGPGGIPPYEGVNNGSAINITNGEIRERPKPQGPGGKPDKQTDVKVDGSIVINRGGEDRYRPKPKGPGGIDAIPVINHTIVAPRQ